MTFRIERVLGLVALGLLAVGCLFVIKPFITSLLWAMVLCYSTWPLFTRLDRLFGGRRSAAALVMTLLICCVIVLPFIGVGITLADDVRHAVSAVSAVKVDSMKEAPAGVARVPLIGDLIANAWVEFFKDSERLSVSVQTTAKVASAWLLKHSLGLVVGVAQLALSALIAFFFYRNGEAVVERVVAAGQRIVGDSTQRLVGLIGRTVRGVVYGIIGTGLAQGFMAWLGMSIAGVNSAVLIGLMTFLFSLIPLGPPLIWIPVAIWLFANKGLGWGLFMAVWGLVAISGIDNFVRPMLISREAKLPFIIIFLGAIGGILAFGFIGLFLGPTLLAVAHSLLAEFVAKRPAAPVAADAG